MKKFTSAKIAFALMVCLITTQVSAFTTTLLYNSTTSSSAISNTNAETVFDQNFTVPDHTLEIGNSLRIRASGRITSSSTPSVLVKVRVGGATVASFLFWTTSVTNAHWALECEIVVRSVDESDVDLGSMCLGYANGHVTPRTPFYDPGAISGSQLVGVIPLATKLDNIIDLTAKWNTASVGNIVVLDTYSIELLN